MKKNNIHFPTQPAPTSNRPPVSSQESWHRKTTTGATYSGLSAANISVKNIHYYMIKQ